MTPPDPVRAIADAVLYEGYILWPYRRSALKNAQRWTFGGVYPRGWSDAGHPDDRWQMQTQVLVSGGAEVDVTIRFLQVVRRQVMADGRAVDQLVVGGERLVSWEEARERELGPGPFSIEEGTEDEVHVVRSWRQLAGTVSVTRERVAGGLDRVTVRVSNTTPFEPGTREEALAHTLCSCHTVLQTDGEFESATDPPAGAPQLENVGTWPVLVGEPPDRSTVLSSPIILEDYPRVAPESPGDLFDGGEVDQLLVLNILALTDEEKAEMRATDPLAREILERTESLTNEQKMALHGQIRELRHVR
jgi:hypothetical protein